MAAPGLNAGLLKGEESINEAFTRSDFDGLICSVLLKEAGIIDEWKFVHPKDRQDVPGLPLNVHKPACNPFWTNRWA